MAAEDNLSPVQFASPHELAEKYWDPSLRDPETFRAWTGPAYVKNLAEDIRQHGIRNPIQLANWGRRTSMQRGLTRGQTYVYDGHNRLLAAMDLGLKEVPYRVVSGRPGEQ